MGEPAVSELRVHLRPDPFPRSADLDLIYLARLSQLDGEAAARLVKVLAARLGHDGPGHVARVVIGLTEHLRPEADIADLQARCRWLSRERLVSDPASEVLEALARDLVAQISAAQLELAREQVRQDAALEMASPPVPDPVLVQADPSGISEYTAPPPGLCAEPGCDHTRMTCCMKRLHTIGGHPGNRSHLLSANSTRPPQGSAPVRGSRGR